MKKSVEKGITLIALVVTIVVLLILAGISISMLTGENGVIIQARKSKEATEQARVEELVSVAIGSVIAKNDGVVNGITPKMVADQINEDEKRSDVYAENETTFPTNIIFPKENRKAEANLNSKNTNDPNYSVSVDESDIAPVDLFDYQIIDNGEIGALTLSSLPTKTVAITNIKDQYCNSGGYNSKSHSMDLENTNYEIIYQNKKIDDTLIIPYKVDGKYIPDGIEGEYYKVIAVNLYACGAVEDNGRISSGHGMPKVRKIIYPDTVEIIYGDASSVGKEGINNILEEVILSKKLKSIGGEAFKKCKALKNIVIPDSVEDIAHDAFDSEFFDSFPDGDIYLGKIYYKYKGEMPSETIIQIKEGTKTISKYAFDRCSGLTKVTIPDSVKNIEYAAFYGCINLTNVIIPDSVEVVGELAFHNTPFYDNLPDGDIYLGKIYYRYKGEMPSETIIQIKEGTKTISECAFDRCSGLTKVTIPDSVKNIEYSAFFRCSGLTEITIGKGISHIGGAVFYGCNNLTTVNYRGTKEMWDNISINTDNELLTNATINYNYTGE